MGLAAKIIKGLGPIESRIEIWLHTYAKFLYSKPIDLERIEIKHVHVTLPRLPNEFNGYRIMQLSDFHIGTWMTEERLRDIVNYANQLQSDLVVITGDFVGHNAEPWEEALVNVLSALRAGDGVLAILGNHDHWTNPETIRRVLRRAKINALINEVYSIRRKNETLYVGGIDDPLEEKDCLDVVLEQVPVGECLILLSHEPDFADISSRTKRVDLQLSGHSHGGQMILPLIGPAIRIPMAEKYPLGMYRINGMWQYTNRGLGTGIIPLRINCPPEITIFELCITEKSERH